MNNKDKDFVVQFGQKVKALRKELGFTQLDLSVKTNIPRTQIGRIERGEVNTTITTVKVLSDVLNIPITEFFIWDSDQ